MNMLEQLFLTHFSFEQADRILLLLGLTTYQQVSPFKPGKICLCGLALANLVGAGASLCVALIGLDFWYLFINGKGTGKRKQMNNLFISILTKRV